MLWVSTVTMNTRVIKKHKIRVRFFGLTWFGRTNPSGLLKNVLKYFRFWFRIRRGIPLYILSIHIDSFRVSSEYEQIHSVYAHYTNRFILRILSLQQIHSASSQYMN